MRGIIIALAGMSLTSFAQAEPDRILYELQERCGKQAAALFQKEWGWNLVSDKDSFTIANYENHYSPRLNKCFYVEISNYTSKTPEGYASRTLTLYDLNENRQYGSFVSSPKTGISECQVQGKTCRSEEEWRELTKPFLDE